MVVTFPLLFFLTLIVFLKFDLVLMLMLLWNISDLRRDNPGFSFTF